MGGSTSRAGAQRRHDPGPRPRALLRRRRGQRRVGAELGRRRRRRRRQHQLLAHARRRAAGRRRGQPRRARGPQGDLANPNCSTMQMVVALKPLHDAAGIERLVISTYQAVSGTGKAAIDELLDQSRATPSPRLGSTRPAGATEVQEKRSRTVQADMRSSRERARAAPSWPGCRAPLAAATWPSPAPVASSARSSPLRRAAAPPAGRAPSRSAAPARARTRSRHAPSAPPAPGGRASPPRPPPRTRPPCGGRFRRMSPRIAQQPTDLVLEHRHLLPRAPAKPLPHGDGGSCAVHPRPQPIPYAVRPRHDSHVTGRTGPARRHTGAVCLSSERSARWWARRPTTTFGGE